MFIYTIINFQDLILEITNGLNGLNGVSVLKFAEKQESNQDQETAYHLKMEGFHVQLQLTKNWLPAFVDTATVNL